MRILKNGMEISIPRNVEIQTIWKDTEGLGFTARLLGAEKFWENFPNDWEDCIFPEQTDDNEDSSFTGVLEGNDDRWTVEF